MPRFLLGARWVQCGLAAQPARSARRIAPWAPACRRAPCAAPSPRL